MELVWLRAITVSLPFVWVRAQRSILWDMVLVNSTSRSGRPRRSFSPSRICVNTFALQRYSLHSSLYCRTMQSFPPTITTLISTDSFAPIILASANSLVKYYLPRIREKELP